MPKIIPEILIDDEDFNKVSKYTWRIRWDGRAHSQIRGKMTLLHRYILDAPNGFQVDHIDGNPLNNRKVNLRLCTNSQNQMNSKKRSNCKSKYKGVTFRKGMYVLHVRGKHIRAFQNEMDAAIGYDIIAKQLYGEFCRPNFPDGLSKKDLDRISNLLTFKKEGVSYFSSKYKGIGFHKNSGKWRARVNCKDGWKTLGYHKTEEEALKQLRSYHEYSSN